MELGENNNSSHPPLIPYSKRRRHSWLCVLNGIVSDSIRPWDLRFVPWRQAAGTGGGKKLLLVDLTAIMPLLLYFFCSVIALDEMGFIPGNRKDILVLSWFREQLKWRLRHYLLWIPNPGGLSFSLTSASSSRAALTQDNKPAL